MLQALQPLDEHNCVRFPLRFARAHSLRVPWYAVHSFPILSLNVMKHWELEEKSS